MPNYYEVLKVAPTASTSEIQVAFDSQYNYWRRLVTHHEAETAQRANQALLYLERIRVTLTDPTQRTAYDLSLGGSVGGLADPNAAPQNPPSPFSLHLLRR